MQRCHEVGGLIGRLATHANPTRAIHVTPAPDQKHGDRVVVLIDRPVQQRLPTALGPDAPLRRVDFVPDQNAGHLS